MQVLALKSRVYSLKAQELSFLDAQQRLKHMLIKLADEHGITTYSGIEIGVHITHEDIGALINVNRTTIALCLQELEKLGYLQPKHQAEPSHACHGWALGFAFQLFQDTGIRIWNRQRSPPWMIESTR